MVNYFYHTRKTLQLENLGIVFAEGAAFGEKSRGILLRHGEMWITKSVMSMSGRDICNGKLQENYVEISWGINVFPENFPCVPRPMRTLMPYRHITKLKKGSK